MLKTVAKITLGITAGALTITSIYGLNFYHAEEHMDYGKGVRIKRNFGWMEYGDPEKCTTAIMFYPGGKVGLNAYGELLTRVAKAGYYVIVCGMPVNLAVLNPNAADKYVKRINEKYPNIKEWYIGGHSLGGTIACKHAINRPGVYKGVIFLAAYPDSKDDMNGTNLAALSVYGSLDSVMNREKYEAHKHLFPKGRLFEMIIEGGNHGNFGTYGFQNGDHTSLIDRLDQIDQTASAIVRFIEMQ